MKKILFSFFAAGMLAASSAIAQEPTSLETARNYMRGGDWDNAILVLNRALVGEPNNVDLQKELALSHYYKRDFSRALQAIKPLLESDKADVQVYQIGGNVYKALEEVKDAEKMYKKALKKFPQSGPLYSEYGELLWEHKDFEAIKLWEKGIEVAPSYAGNYYNAALYHYYNRDKIWTLIYGEIFVNMEYLTERATQMKKLLLSTYREKLFNNTDAAKEVVKGKNNFSKAVMQSYYKQVSLVNRGINLEVLNMIRTRFVLDWFATNGSKYPFRLFEYQQQLIKEGLFEAYNQWLFGTIENLPAFDQWTRANAEVYNKFTAFQKNRIFKMPAGQYYQTKD